jgi:hypothetical protein
VPVRTWTTATDAGAPLQCDPVHGRVARQGRSAVASVALVDPPDLIRLEPRRAYPASSLPATNPLLHLHSNFRARSTHRCQLQSPRPPHSIIIVAKAYRLAFASGATHPSKPALVTLPGDVPYPAQSQPRSLSAEPRHSLATILVLAPLESSLSIFIIAEPSMTFTTQTEPCRIASLVEAIPRPT